MEKEVAYDFGTGFVVLAFSGAAVGTTGFILYQLFKLTSLYEILTTIHFSLIGTVVVLFGFLLTVFTGRMVNRILQSKGVKIY